MNDSAQNFSRLAFLAFEECSTKAELNYVARTLGEVSETRREAIAELLEKYVTERPADVRGY